MKRGAAFPFEKLIQIMMTVMEILAVGLIIAGIIYVIIQAGKEPPDLDFKRVMQASAKLIDDFDEGRIRGTAEMSVPVASEKPFDIAFFPDGGPEDRCKGKPCLCMYYILGGGAPKTTCKIINIAQKCTQTECGEELCAGPLVKPYPEVKGGQIIIRIQCTTQGSQFVVT